MDPATLPIKYLDKCLCDHPRYRHYPGGIASDCVDCTCTHFESFEQLVQQAQDQHRKELADELDKILLQIKQHDQQP